MYQAQAQPVSYRWNPFPSTHVPFAAPTHVPFVAPYARLKPQIGTPTPPVVAETQPVVAETQPVVAETQPVVAETQPVEGPSEIALDSSVPSAPSAGKWTIAGAIAGDLLTMLGALVVFLAGVLASVCVWLRKMAEKKAEKAPVEAHAVAPVAHDVPEPGAVKGVLASGTFGATAPYKRITATPTSAQTVVPQGGIVRERVKAFQRLDGALVPVNTARPSARP